MSESELKFIENCVKRMISQSWKKLINKLCDIDDLVIEAQIACLLAKRKYGIFPHGKATIARICRNKIINHINRDIKWFTKPGRINDRFIMRIPDRQGLLRGLTPILDKKYVCKWHKKQKEMHIETEKLIYIRELSKIKNRQWILNNKQLIINDFWKNIY